jgi:radical SAM superfamily enzyme YgiQ (UPF0313 family)
MPTSSVLVTYNSYPNSLDFLTPDNGLANLAGTLLQAGHETRIADLCTVSTVRRLVPPGIATEIGPAFDAYMGARDDRERAREPLERLEDLDRQLDAHRSEVSDQLADEVAAIVEEADADFVGFKLWTGDGFLASMQMAKRLKARFPTLPIVGGGPHVDCFGADILRHTDAFDMVVQGEGEPAIVAVADAIQSGRGFENVPNLIHRDGDGVRVNPTQRVEDLDSLAGPEYGADVYPALAADEKLLTIMVDESRGCPNRCAFCVHPAKSGGFWRVRSASSTADTMQDISRKLDVTAFRLAGSNTPATFKTALAQELITRGCDFRYAAFAHVRDSGLDFDLLRRSGCVVLFYGVESGSQPILDRLNKRVRAEQATETVSRTRAAGIATIVSLIAGCPGETPETLEETFELVKGIRPEGVQVTPPGVMPGSSWWERPEEYGIQLDADARERFMTFAVKWLMPIELWDSLPYSIDGKSFAQLAADVEWLTAKLEQAGIVTGLNEVSLLIGDYLGLTPREARDFDRRVFVDGDIEAVARNVRSFNHRSRATRPGIVLPSVVRPSTAVPTSDRAREDLEPPATPEGPRPSSSPLP